MMYNNLRYIFYYLWLFFFNGILLPRYSINKGDRMRLFIKRDKSPDSTDFVIFGESGEERYKTLRKNTASKKSVNLRIVDASGKTAAKIRKFPFAPASIFFIRLEKSRLTFVAVPSKNGLYSYFYGSNRLISGNVAAKNFSVIDVDKSVVFSHRRRMGYAELEITCEKNEAFSVAVSVCANLINTVEKHELKPA